MKLDLYVVFGMVPDYDVARGGRPEAEGVGPFVLGMVGTIISM